VFDKTYEHYLSRIRDLSLPALQERLGIEVRGESAVIPLFGRPYRVSGEGVYDPLGKQPPLEVSVILCRYLLMCPEEEPKKSEWVSFRDFRDTAPLRNYFKQEVEGAITKEFTRKTRDLAKASGLLGGVPLTEEYPHDITVRFQALPRVPLLMLFNDEDDEFPAACSVLFEKRAEKYLDGECLAILGRLLFTSLISAYETKPPTLHLQP